MEKQWLETLLKQHHGKIDDDQKSISHILNIEQEPAVAKGENFASVILRYKITVQHKSGEKSTKQIIVKTIPECARLAAYCTETPIFKNEIFAYSVVLKEMEALMNEFKDQREILWGKLIGYNKYDKVVLEDLKVKNYAVMNRVEMLDYEHSIFVMKALARYHAMSATLLKRNILKPSDFATLIFVSNKDMIDLFFVSFFTKFAETVNNNWGPEWSELAERLYKACDTVLEKYINMGKYQESRFNVINHGDCWTNNLMFRHKPGTNTPTGLRFIDFQLGHCNSCAWDLTYFLYNAVLPEIRRSRYLELLTAYHTALVENLTMYKYPKEEIPTMDYILEEMERLKFFGFGLLTSIHAFTSASVADSYDLFQSYENKQNRTVGINTDIFACKFFRHKVEDDMRAFMEQGVI